MRPPLLMKRYMEKIYCIKGRALLEETRKRSINQSLQQKVLEGVLAR